MALSTTLGTARTSDPLAFGVGCRITASVMADDYARVITGALDSLDTSGLTLVTGDVSTYAGGSEKAILRLLTDLGEALAASGHHVSLAITLSRGCPGEVACEAPGGAGPRAVEAPTGRRTGHRAAGEWALYPLADPAAVPGGSAPDPDHMRDIWAAIEVAKELGTFRVSEHFATRLEGDLGDVLATVVRAWVIAGRSVQHVTSHLTVSLNSPSWGESASGAAQAPVQVEAAESAR